MGDGPDRAPPIDRRVFGEILQRVPSDHYTLILRSPELGGARWRRCVIGDLPGPEVVRAIEEGMGCLCLTDIGDLLRDRLERYGHRFPKTTRWGERIRHGLVIASADLSLALPDEVGSGMLRPIEGTVRLSFEEARPEHGDLDRDWSVTIGPDRDFHWRDACPRRFETGSRMVIALNRRVVATPAVRLPWRIDRLVENVVERATALRERIVGRPERWATTVMGTSPLGGRPGAPHSLGHAPEFRLMRRPVRGAGTP